MKDSLLEALPEDMLFEIKQYFHSCKKCKKTIIDEDIIEKCDICKDSWCCSNNNTNKMYFEVTLNVCGDCGLKFNKTTRKRRRNIIAYNYFST